MKTTGIAKLVSRSSMSNLLNSSQSESVVVRCRVSGTHKGVAARPVNGALLMNVAPTGRRFEVQHIHWYKIHDGKITHHATNRDDLGMLQQLGVIPVPNCREN